MPALCGNINAQQADTLDIRQQNIVLIASTTAAGDLENLKTALVGGLDSGMTVNEIKEVLVHAYAYCGFPRSLRALIANPEDDFARGELMWDSALAENSLLKLGKQTDFQCHMIEHAVGAYTDCNHGQGLAIIHPAVYRHLIPEGTEKLAKMAERVWNINESNSSVAALKCIAALEDFILEIGLPTHWSEIGISDENVFRAAADTCILTPGCCRQFTRDEVFAILKECM